MQTTQKQYLNTRNHNQKRSVLKNMSFPHLTADNSTKETTPINFRLVNNKVSRYFRYSYCQPLFPERLLGMVQRTASSPPLTQPTSIQQVLTWVSSGKYWEVDHSAEHNQQFVNVETTVTTLAMFIRPQSRKIFTCVFIFKHILEF